MVENIEDREAGMTPPTIDLEAETDNTKSRKLSMTAKAKARPSGSITEQLPSWGPTPPSEAPPPPPTNKRKDIENTTNLKDNDGEQWVQAKIAEAVEDWHDGDWHGDNSDGWRDGGYDNSGDGHDGGYDNSGDWRDDGGYDDWFDETHDAKEFGFSKAWQMALQQYNVDKAAQLQLALLRDHDWYAASDVVWKLTKKGSYDDELKNPSGFVNRCCTTAFKNAQW